MIISKPDFKVLNNKPSVYQLVSQSCPEESICCLRTHIINRTFKWFLDNFPGKTLYPVKTNPDPRVLSALFAAGLRDFDVASLNEIDLVYNLLPNTNLYFMHPIKSRNAIQKAYFDYGVRDFVLDNSNELNKILEQTDYAKDLNLFVRLAVPNYHSEISLSGKFGINQKDAITLLKHTRTITDKLGISFHVGSQCMNPIAFANAINLTAEVLTQANIKIEVLDVGGGFPTAYSNLMPPPLHTYMDEISNSLERYPTLGLAEVICEAGRAMVAESSSLVVKVELRKGNALYINDGIYGSLFEAGHSNFIYPVRLIRKSSDSGKKLLPFKFYGPTCDSADVMEGPFYLPGDIEEGDYIEIGQLGAYGRTMQSNFNGFASNHLVEVTDEPLLSILDIQAQQTVLANQA